MKKACWTVFSVNSMNAGSSRLAAAVLALGTLAVQGLACGDARADVRKTTVEQFTLANGMEVIVIPNHRIPAVSQMVWYRVGAGDDPAGKGGLAHFHEHAMFLGTEKHKAGEFAAIAAGRGGDQNAFTNRDATAYYISVPRAELPLAMDLESDRMRALTPTPEAIEKEREVIIEERRMRTDNNPDALLAEQVDAALFRNHPYGRPVIGWKHEMQGLTRQDVLDFHRRWYAPGNALLIISGDTTAAEVRPLAEKYYGRIPARPVPSRRWTDEPPQNVKRRLVLHHANVKQPKWSRTYAAPGVAYGAREHAIPMMVFATLLGEGKTSRLYQSLVVAQKLASGVSARYDAFNIGPGTFEISIVPEKGVDMAALEKAVDAQLADALSKPIADDELVRARNLLRAETIFARDSLTSVARIMGTIRLCGLDTGYFDRWPEMIAAATPEQISDAAKFIIRSDASVTSWLLPEEIP